MNRRELVGIGSAGPLALLVEAFKTKVVQAPVKEGFTKREELAIKREYFLDMDRRGVVLDKMPFLTPEHEVSDLFLRRFTVYDRFPTTTGEWSWPIRNLISTRFFSWHPGIDIIGSLGQPIGAADGGQVLGAEWNRNGFGYHVVVNHGSGLFTLYAHMSSFAVKAGDMVKKEDVLGGVGSTGNSTGPHLHFGIIQVTPTDYGDRWENLNPLNRLNLNEPGIEIIPSSGSGPIELSSQPLISPAIK